MPLALARQRLLTAKFPYYEIRLGSARASRAVGDASSPTHDAPARPCASDLSSEALDSAREGACAPPSNCPSNGFVYRRRQNARGEEVGGIVPHVTLKSIANNERAFFSVAQAFFPRTAAWDNLKRELRGVYADSVWEHLAGTVSEPFAAGEHRQIAVKVIDDRGNELMVVRKLSEAEHRK